MPESHRAQRLVFSDPAPGGLLRGALFIIQEHAEHSPGWVSYDTLRQAFVPLDRGVCLFVQRAVASRQPSPAVFWCIAVAFAESVPDLGLGHVLQATALGRSPAYSILRVFRVPAPAPAELLRRFEALVTRFPAGCSLSWDCSRTGHLGSLRRVLRRPEGAPASSCIAIRPEGTRDVGTS